jgi:hypothetical protein
VWRCLHRGVRVSVWVNECHGTGVSSGSVQQCRCWGMHQLCGRHMEQRQSEDQRMHQWLRRGVRVSIWANECHGTGVSRWTVQRWCRGGMRGVSCGYVRCHRWPAVINVQWELHRGLRVPDRVHQRHSVHLSCGTVQRWCGCGMHVVSCWYVRCHRWQAIISVQRKLYRRVRVPRGVHQRHGVHLSCGTVQRWCRGSMHVVSCRHVWCHRWPAIVSLQRELPRGVLLSDRVHQRYRVRVPCGHVQPVGSCVVHHLPAHCSVLHCCKR